MSEFQTLNKNLTEIKESDKVKLESRIDRKKMEVVTVNLKKGIKKRKCSGMSICTHDLREEKYEH